MTNKRKFIIFSLLIGIVLISSCHKKNEIKFSPSWESLSQYQAPEWYRDAKFGIYMHWGPMSVAPDHGGWYGRQMYMQNGAEWGNDYQLHLKNFGHPSVFGYKDLIPLWKAEKWNPDSLVMLYKEIGARYVVAVAVHHDNFDLYNSTYQPWNSVNMGPKRDIVGEWRAATLKQGLRFGVTSHSDRSWTWFSTSFESDSTGPLKGVPYDGNMITKDGKGKWWEGYNPQDLYPRPHSKSDPADSAYLIKWFKRTKELIDKYQPDLLWFDGPIPLVGTNSPIGKDGRPIHEKYGLEIASYFYNENQKWHNGKLEAVLNIKSWGEGTVADEQAVVMNIEKGGVDEINIYPWQTDTSIPNTWFYNGDGKAELSDTVIIHNLCDIVSKNGNMMLNVGLRPNGTLPQHEIAILKNIGSWLKMNGEAIYATRPWIISGEGTTETIHGEFKQNVKPFTSTDIRFTTKGNVLYAIVLGWPKTNQINIKSLHSKVKLWFGEISSVELLGYTDESEIEWRRDDKGLEIQFPAINTSKFAYVFRIK